METIKYINDLEIEIAMLKDLMNEFNKSELTEKISRKQDIIDRCKENMKKLSNNKVCYKIYLNILDGMSVSKAIEKVAEENLYNDVKPQSANHIWRDYYPKLKKILQTQVKPK